MTDLPADGLCGAGLALCVVGLWIVHPALALIGLGAGCLAFGVVLYRQRQPHSKRPPDDRLQIG